MSLFYMLIVYVFLITIAFASTAGSLTVESSGLEWYRLSTADKIIVFVIVALETSVCLFTSARSTKNAITTASSNNTKTSAEQLTCLTTRPNFATKTTTNPRARTVLLIMTAVMSSTTDNDVDLYIWLEDIESDESLQFTKDSIAKFLTEFGNSETATPIKGSKGCTFQCILEVLEPDDRIPYVAQYGCHDVSGESIVMNPSTLYVADGKTGRSCKYSWWRIAFVLWHVLIRTEFVAGFQARSISLPKRAKVAMTSLFDVDDNQPNPFLQSTVQSIITNKATTDHTMKVTRYQQLAISVSIACGTLTTFASRACAIHAPATVFSITADELIPTFVDSSNLIGAFQHLAITFLVPLAVALIQGGAAMLNYKSNFGDAPPPKVPAHGLVITTMDNESPYIPDKVSSMIGSASTPLATIKQAYDQFRKSIDFNRTLSNDDFLRLLLIGDSLAVGIGQSATCTPVMPESIAKEISKGTGKAVYWTCHGESGASTSWIVRMLKNSTEVQEVEDIYQAPDFEKWEGKNRRFHGNFFTNGSDTYAAEGLWADATVNANSLAVWKKRLASYRSNFDPTAMGPYDIVVLLTGSNDLKTMLFPFLPDDDEKEYRQQTKEDSKGLIESLVSLMETINDKVERRLQNALDGLTEKVDNLLDGIFERFDAISEAIKVLRSTENITETMEESIRGSINILRNEADFMNEDTRAQKEALSESLQMLLSNHSISEKVDRGLVKPMKRLRGKTVTVANDVFESASNGFRTLRSNLEDLERLFEIASDYSQILRHDDFKGLSSNATTRDEYSSLESPQNRKAVFDESDALDDVLRPGRTLFVLPAMPAQALPVFRKVPLKWIAVPVFNMMDEKKRKLAKLNQDILFVRDPPLKEIVDYEGRRGRVWNQVRGENVLLSIKDIRQEDCVSIESSMRDYFRAKEGFRDLVHDRRPLSEQAGLPGTKIFSADRIHPNDVGYDFWGRYIGNAIIQELAARDKSCGGV